MKKILNVLFLTATLSAPLAMVASADQAVVVYKDSGHHDTHEWNHDEDGRYRVYLKEHHRKYRDFKRLNQKEQEEYWAWRHEH